MVQSAVQALEGSLARKLSSPLSESRVIAPFVSAISPPKFYDGEEKANVMTVRSDMERIYSDTMQMTWQQFWSRQDVQPYRGLGNNLLCRQEYEFFTDLFDQDPYTIASSMATEDYRRFDHMLQFSPLVGLFSHYRVIDFQISVVFRVVSEAPVCIYMQPKVYVAVPSLPLGRHKSVIPLTSYDPVTEVMGMNLATDDVIGTVWNGTVDDWSGTGIDKPRDSWEIEIGIRGVCEFDASLRCMVGVTYCLY